MHDASPHIWFLFVESAYVMIRYCTAHPWWFFFFVTLFFLSFEFVTVSTVPRVSSCLRVFSCTCVLLFYIGTTASSIKRQYFKKKFLCIFLSTVRLFSSATVDHTVCTTVWKWKYEIRNGKNETLIRSYDTYDTYDTVLSYRSHRTG